MSVIAWTTELRSAWTGDAPVPTRATAGLRSTAWPVAVSTCLVITPAAALFRVVIERKAASIHDCIALYFLIAVEITIVPRDWVRCQWTSTLATVVESLTPG